MRNNRKQLNGLLLILLALSIAKVRKNNFRVEDNTAWVMEFVLLLIHGNLSGLLYF